MLTPSTLMPMHRSLLLCALLFTNIALAAPKKVPNDYPGPVQVVLGAISEEPADQPGDKYYRMPYVHLERTDQEVQLWLPGGVESIKGVIVDVGFAFQPRKTHLQEFARTQDFAVMGGMFRYARMTDSIALALEHMGNEIGHPELARAPWITMGFSRMGRYAVRFAQEAPERTISVFFGGSPGVTADLYTKDPTKDQTAVEGNAKTLSGVPMITVSGSQDAYVGLNKGEKRGYFDWEQKNYPRLRARGLPVTAATEWGPGHETFNNGAMLFPFWRAVMAKRLPAAPAQGPVELRPVTVEEGWLADPGNWGVQEDGKLVEQNAAAAHFTPAVPYAEYKGDKSAAVWLPDAYTAAVWRAFCERPRGVKLAVSGSGAAITLAVESERAEPIESAQFFDGDRLLGEAESAPFEWKSDRLGDRRGVHSVFAVCRAGGLEYHTQPVQILGGKVMDQRAAEAAGSAAAKAAQEAKAAP